MKKVFIFFTMCVTGLLFSNCELYPVVQKGGELIIRAQVPAMGYHVKIKFDQTEKTIEELEMPGGSGRVKIEVPYDGIYTVYYQMYGPPTNPWKNRVCEINNGSFVETVLAFP
ncbi:MAG: hypothetical protein LBG79_06285 [Spirochaetaceae bacterium]|jgi:hypothetical protein|nr:hypothetical protein [Spirochaetaceae bacterium]GMO17479.1 MAG: hypothetical protein Pg6A_03910 [Termitinemataceae bacterium]